MNPDPKRSSLALSTSDDEMLAELGLARLQRFKFWKVYEKHRPAPGEEPEKEFKPDIPKTWGCPAGGFVVSVLPRPWRSGSPGKTNGRPSLAKGMSPLARLWPGSGPDLAKGVMSPAPPTFFRRARGRAAKSSGAHARH